MTNDPRHDPLLDAEVIRCAADGELTPDQAEALDARRAADPVAFDNALAFETELRTAVGRVMRAAPPAPEALRARIMDSFHGSTPAARGGAEGGPIPITRQPSRADSGAGAPSGWFGRNWWFSLAATFMVAVTVIAVLQRGGTTTQPSGAPAAASVIPAAQAERLREFLGSAHDRCSDFGEVFKKKMVAQSPAEAQQIALEILERVPSVLDLPSSALVDQGYEFAGLGRCAVPGKGRSVHLVYRSAMPGAPPVSLFVQEDLGELNLEKSCAYSACLCKKAGRYVAIWRQDGLIYYLVTPDEASRVPARRAFHVPENERSVL